MTQARITRVRLENYKSIKFCDVTLEPITVLVGQNGSGKSNFLDAIFFIVEACSGSLSDAMRSRRGISEIINKDFSDSTQKPYCKITLNFRNSKGVELEYGLSLIWDKSKNGKNSVKIQDYISLNGIPYTESQLNLDKDGKDEEIIFTRMKVFNTDLAEFYSSLVGSFSYNPLPERMKNSESNQFEGSLLSDGSNVASVIYNLQNDYPNVVQKISRYLNRINPYFISFDAEKIKDAFIFVNFRSAKKDSKPMTLFNVSSGTARALALLVAIFLPRYENKAHRVVSWQPLLAFEEPELGLHPAATEIVLAALRQRSSQAQFLITTHSPSLLAEIKLESGQETVLAVETFDGETYIDQIDNASRQAVEKNLFNLGELLEMQQLEPRILIGKDR